MAHFYVPNATCMDQIERSYCSGSHTLPSFMNVAKSRESHWNFYFKQKLRKIMMTKSKHYYFTQLCAFSLEFQEL